jgi:phage gpG-like protein
VSEFISIACTNESTIKALKLAVDKLRNPRPLLGRFNDIILLDIDINYEQERSPDGVKWQDNTPFTLSQKRAQRRIMKVLQSTGRGRDSIHGEIVGDRLIIGTNVGYMKKHQLGIGVPKREFLGISKDALKDCLAEVDDYLS